MIDEDAIRRIGASKKAKIRRTYDTYRAQQKPLGLEYPSQGQYIYRLYPYEAILRLISNSEFGDKMVLKGGTMMRVWYNPATSRPSVDIDFQMVDDPARSNPEQVRDWLLDMLTSEQFAMETGIIASRDLLRVDQIKEDLPGSWKVEGKVQVGHGNDAMMLEVYVEVSVEAAPDWLYERVTIETITDDPAISTLATTKEWMTAEKLHSIVNHGMENTRFKDFYDLSYKLFKDDLDLDKLWRAVAFVFDTKQTPFPATADEKIGFTAGFATPEKEKTWASSARWSRFHGTAHDPSVDLTLAEACESISSHLEHMGLFEPCPTAKFTEALHTIAANLSALQSGNKSAKTTVASAFGILLRHCDSLTAHRVQARYNSDLHHRNADKAPFGTIIMAVMSIIRDNGMLATLEQTWTQHMTKPFPEAINALDRLANGTAATNHTKPHETRTAPAKQDDISPEAIERAKADLGTCPPNMWSNLLATLVRAKEAGLLTAPYDVAKPKFGWPICEKSWKGVAKKHGLNDNLFAVLDTLRETPGPKLG
jgi:predicted nucleotidyltransferase component of viral defense system